MLRHQRWMQQRLELAQQQYKDSRDDQEQLQREELFRQQQLLAESPMSHPAGTSEKDESPAWVTLGPPPGLDTDDFGNLSVPLVNVLSSTPLPFTGSALHALGKCRRKGARTARCVEIMKDTAMGALLPARRGWDSRSPRVVKRSR